MPLLNLDPSEAQSLETTIQENNLNPPASPTAPTQTADSDPATPSGVPRSLGVNQTFTPFVAKDPKDEIDAKFVNMANNHLANGGKMADFDSEFLSELTRATQGGTGALEDKDVLDDSEKFYQLKFRPGKYEKSILDDLGNPYIYPKLAVDFVTNPIKTIANTLIGMGQIATHPQDSAAVFSEGWAVNKQFYKSLNPFLEVPGMGAVGAGISLGLQLARGPAALAGTQAQGPAAQTLKTLGIPETSAVADIVQDLSLRTKEIFKGDEHSREEIDRAQSEIARGRMQRDQAAEDMISSAKYKAADTLASIGLNDWADITRKAVVTPEERGLAQMVTDPLTYLEFGLGKAAGATKAGVRMGRMETATVGLAKAGETVDNLAIQRKAFEGIVSAPGATQQERIAAQRALAAQAPLERDAQAAHAAATQEHQAAVAATSQDLTEAAQPSFGRQRVGEVMQGVGVLAESAGKVAEWVTELPARIVSKILPDLDELTKTKIAGALSHYLIGPALGAVGGTALGGPVGGFIAGLGTLIAPSIAKKFGRDLAMIGKQFALGQETLPFWKGIKENSTGMTRQLASFLDNQLVYAIPDTARGAVAGAALGGTIGAIQSGGTTQGTIGGASSGGVFGAAGAGLGQIKKFNSPAELHAAKIGDRARFLRSLNPENAKYFQAMKPPEQLAISVYARAHPDVMIDFFAGGPHDVNGDHQVIGDRGLIRINVNGDNPFHKVMAHETGHHTASHGLNDEVNARMLGDVATGRPGVFTKFDENGKPMVDIPDANGIVRYLPNDEFEKFKADYNKRLPADRPKAGNYDIAQELFAELHAQTYVNPIDLQKAVRGYVPDALVGGNMISNWLVRMGVGADPITGHSVITPDIANTKGLRDILKNFYTERQYKSNPVSDDTGHVRVPVDTARRGTDEFGRLSQTFDATTALRRNPDGTLWTDSAGRPAIVPTREMDAIHGQMTDDIISAIKANPQYQTMPGDYVKLVTDRRGREYYRGQILQPEAKAKLVASNKYNAVQVLNLTKLGGAMERNDGTMFTQIYNTAGKKGKYATLPAQERAVVPLYFEIDPKTRQTNILSYDPEQMNANITKVLRRGEAKKLWDGKIQTMTDDVLTYLGNITNGRPGETGIGLEKKGVINNLFGQAADANPLIGDITRKSPSVFKTFRLDRINRLNELSATMPVNRETYERVRAYAQPRLGFEGVPAEPPTATTPIATTAVTAVSDKADHELPRPATPEEAGRLPKGTHFIDPKGKRRRVP